ncbi:hypothetical protein I79_025691 [Cricetulus griseus]|uniref:Uncharacterized protein n=1 Tax=Cricetulus griseus TaxID=10029 RepID=G3INZ3_CRIGR|nr:hypothetical protein I79_025691 [Cricetulus griseus]
MCIQVWEKHPCFLFQLFYSKFTEYLEDFHIWLSLYSQPTSSSYLHAQRLAVSFCLLCVYSCLTALVTVGVHEQRSLDVGPTLESFSLGLLCTILACPATQLLSLLFRFSKICLAALVFAWKRKHDSQFFVESLHDATKDLDLELEEYSRAHILHFRSSCSPDSAEEAERVSRIGKFQNCSVPTMQMGAQTLVQI